MKTLGLVEVGGGLITAKQEPFFVGQKEMRAVAREVKTLFTRYWSASRIPRGGGLPTHGDEWTQTRLCARRRALLPTKKPRVAAPRIPRDVRTQTHGDRRGGLFYVSILAHFKCAAV